MKKIKIPEKFRKALEKRFPVPSVLKRKAAENIVSWLIIYEPCPLCGEYFDSGVRKNCCVRCPFEIAVAEENRTVPGCIVFMEKIPGSNSIAATRSAMMIKPSGLKGYTVFRDEVKKRIEWVK